METLGFSIKVNHEKVVLLVDFLLRNKVQFTLQSNEAVENVDTTSLKKVYSIKNIQKNKNSIDDIYEKVIDKYLSGDFSNPMPTIVEISKEFKINIQKLKKVFIDRNGRTLYQIYMSKRMEKACELLEVGYNANQVSKLLGYGEKSSIKFNKMFQKYYGITPKKYQINVLSSNKLNGSYDIRI